MKDRLHKTRGIVLKTIRYGETSLVVTIYTEIFGIQSYMVNGVRSNSKSAGSKANLLQPASILDMVVYHHENRQLNRIKEFKWAYLYKKVLSDVITNAVAMYMVELFHKCLKQPEPNADMYYFMEDCLQNLDHSPIKIMANFPLFFSVHLPVFFGFRISVAGLKNSEHVYLDLENGVFINQQPDHPNFLEGSDALVVADILSMQQPATLDELSLNQDTRRRILYACERYYLLHVPEFGQLKTLPVLRDILS